MNKALYHYGITIDFFQIDEIEESYIFPFENLSQLSDARNKSLIKISELLIDYPYINGFDYYISKTFWVEEKVFGELAFVPKTEKLFFWKSTFKGDYKKNNCLMECNIDYKNDEFYFLTKERIFIGNDGTALDHSIISNAILLISKQPIDIYFDFGYLKKLSPLIQKILHESFPDKSNLLNKALDDLGKYRLQKKIHDYVFTLIDKEKKMKPIQRLFSNVFTAYNNRHHQLGFFDGTEVFMK